MKTILILKRNNEEKIAIKDSLLRKFNEEGKTVVWSDDSIEVKDDGLIYFFKVISISDYRTKVMEAIGRGYDEIDIKSVITDVEQFLKALRLSDGSLSLPPTGSQIASENKEEKKEDSSPKDGEPNDTKED